MFASLPFQRATLTVSVGEKKNSRKRQVTGTLNIVVAAKSKLNSAQKKETFKSHTRCSRKRLRTKKSLEKY